MTNHQSSSSSSSSQLVSQSSFKMHRLIISITLLTSLLASSTLSVPQQTQQRKSQQQRDTSEDGSRASGSGEQPSSLAAGAQFQCPEQFGYYMDTRDCTKYYVCVFGEVLHESCTGGLRFSRELQTCDWPRNVECKQDNMTASLTTPEPSNLSASQQSAEVGQSEQNQKEQATAATTGVQQQQQQHQASSSDESARSHKGSQMVFADEGADPQQPSFDETVSPVITPDGTIHLHDGSGGTFGLGRAPPLDSAGQSVDVFVKPVTSLAPISVGASSPRQRQQVSQQRPTTASVSSSSGSRGLSQQQQATSTRQPPQLSGGEEEASSTRDAAAAASGQPATTGADEPESGEQPTEASDSVGLGGGADNGAGDSSSVETGTPTGEREELVAAREGAEEAELEGDVEDGNGGPTASPGYVPPFSTTQQLAGAGSSRQHSAADTLAAADKDGVVSFDSGEELSAASGSGDGTGGGAGAGELSGSTHPAESREQVSPTRDNDAAAQGRRDEEEEQQHKPRQSQRRQNQTQSLHPHLPHQNQQQQHQLQLQLQLQKGLSSAPSQQTVAGNNRQSRMSNFQQQQQQQQQAQLQLLNKASEQASRGFSARGPKLAPTSGQYLHTVNFNDSSKLIRFQAASHQLMELPGLLDESSSTQNDAATSFPQQPQFPSPRSQSLLFSERPFGGESLSTMLDDGAAVTRPSSRQRFLDTSTNEPQQQSFMTTPRRPRPPKRQQIPSGGGTRPVALPSNSFRPANFSSSSSSSSSTFPAPHHHSLSTLGGGGASSSVGSLPESFLVSREPPTPFVESDALAGGPPLMMMRGPPGGWRPPSGGQQQRPFAATGTGPPAAGSRRPASRHFSEPAAGDRSQGQLDPSSITAPPAAMTASRATSSQLARQRAHHSASQPPGSATTNAGSGSLLAPTPPTTTPIATTTASAGAATTTQLATSQSAAANLPTADNKGATQQEQDPQLVANRYLNSAIDALEAGQPFGAVDYDFEILNDNLSDRRNPGSGSGSTTSTSSNQQQQHRPPTTSRAHQSQRSQSTGAAQGSGRQGGRARGQQQLQQRPQLPALGPQLATNTNNRSALFNPNKQMDSAALARLREEAEVGGGSGGGGGGGSEEERVSLANGQPVAGEQRPSTRTLDQQQVTTGGQLPPGSRGGQHSFAGSHSSKPLASSSGAVVAQSSGGANQQQQQQQQQPNTATRKPRPTNKKIVVDHEQALANNRASVEPAKRPEPMFATPQAIQTATKCDNRVCKLPDCKCGDTLVPAGLDPKTIPQVVLLTFDDAVNELNWEIYEELFTGRTNPNGCPILATFYVSHEWTDYGQVQTLYSRGHEIASHSVTHSFGEKFSKNQWFKEVNGQREILNMYGGVKMNDVRGMRAPFLQIGGNKMFEMLYDANFTYDSSMPIFDNLPPMWPYTLDYQLSHECMITPCPTKSFPGVWEVGMTMWVDLRGGRCSMGDACSNPPDEDGVHEMLMKNFNRHYKSNRAPFGLFYHSAWFNTVHHRRGFLKFLSTVNAMSDVFFVTNWQMLQWMRKPTPLSEINSFEPWQCTAKSDRPPPCFHPSVCNVKSEHGTRFMKTCQPCPANHQYPWVGATGFKGKQASLSGSG